MDCLEVHSSCILISSQTFFLLSFEEAVSRNIDGVVGYMWHFNTTQHHRQPPDTPGGTPLRGTNKRLPVNHHHQQQPTTILFSECVSIAEVWDEGALTLRSVYESVMRDNGHRVLKEAWVHDAAPATEATDTRFESTARRCVWTVRLNTPEHPLIST